QAVDIAPITWVEGRADGGADVGARVLCQVFQAGQRNLQGRTYLFGDAPHHVVGGDAPQHYDELVAAQAGHQVAGAYRGPQALGHLRQHPVADVVAEAVVDQLETVEVDEQQGEAVLGGGVVAAPAQGELQLPYQCRAAAQAGQLIGAQLALHLREAAGQLADLVAALQLQVEVRLAATDAFGGTRQAGDVGDHPVGQIGAEQQGDEHRYRGHQRG